MESPDPMLLKAIKIHQSGRVAEARAMYQRILRRSPGNPDALNFLGMLEYQQGAKARGMELLQKSLASAPSNPHAWMNYGNMLLNAKETEKAAEAYEKATTLAPDVWQGWMNRAACLRRQGQLEEAIECLCKAISLRPDHDLAYEKLGLILYRAGRLKELGELYGDWLKYNPDSPTARHMYAAVTGQDIPERATDDYVRRTFDEFADDFDENLSDLGYRAPQLVTEALARHRPPQDGVVGEAGADMLDAGAGTGLCGPLLRPMARSLVAVDLSSRMLAKAKERGTYDELLVMEICEFMRGRPASFDVVASADTLVYFGDLDEVLSAGRACLRQQGLLIFTVERLEGGDASTPFRMGPHGRYMHSPQYLSTAIRDAGLDCCEISEVVLRNELGTEVHGFVVVARRPD